MRNLLLVLGILVFAGAALAEEKPEQISSPHLRVPCNLQSVCIDWDFAQGDQGFTPAVCEVGGAPVWEHGATTFIPGAPGTVWGTVLNADYLNDSGDGLCSPEFEVTAHCNMMEIYHYYDIETNFDGANVTVNGNVVTPIGGYDAVISTSTAFYAWCVDMEDGFTGHVNTWGADCFDLSAFVGQTVSVCFDFGSDSSVTYPGWYIAQVQIGGLSTSVEEGAWGGIKSLFR